MTSLVSCTKDSVTERQKYKITLGLL